RQETKEKEEAAPASSDEKKDPFEEIDFGSFFRDYLDPGYRNSADLEEIERPSFENFLSKPTTLTDYLLWQLGAVSVRPQVYAAAELVIGNLNEDGYLTASEEELLGVAAEQESGVVAGSAEVLEEAAEIGPSAASPLHLVISHTPSPEAVASEEHHAGSPVL